MYIDDWFQTLTKRIKAIEREWGQASEMRKKELLSHLSELRQMSDQVVDLWLQYEEKLSGVMKQIEQEHRESREEEPTEMDLFAETPQQEHGTELFRKGEGFYHLRLYEQARGFFEDLLVDSPDWEQGRLYYAYSLYHCGDKQQALREFRLLSKAADTDRIAAISCNAIGCLYAEEGKWLEARQAFCEALIYHPGYKEAMFNLALGHLHDGEAVEALEILETLLKKDPDDWEGHIAWLHAAKQVAEEETDWVRETPPRLQLPIRQLDRDTLHEMALYLEANGEANRAAYCFRQLIQLDTRDGWAWHGLAWNTWLIHGTRPALPILKKAISLEPGNWDYLFSFGWLLLFDAEESVAAQVFRFILEKNPDHFLTRAGLIVACERMGKMEEARLLADSLVTQSEAYLRGLGYYHLGRLAAIQEQWEQAEGFFLRAHEEAPELQEAEQFLIISRQQLAEADSKSKQEFYRLLPNLTIH